MVEMFAFFYRLALSQESLLERDRRVESLESTLVATQVRERELQQSLSSAQDSLAKTRQELSLVTSELASVREERRAFDDVIANLKSNMERVERSFGQIKQELAQKTDEVARLKAEKEQHNVALTQAKEVSLADVHLKTNQTVTSSSSAEASAALQREISSLKQENTQLSQQVEKLSSLKSQHDAAAVVSRDTLDDLHSVTQQFRDALDMSSNRLDIPQLESLVAAMCEDGDAEAVASENRQLKLVVMELVKRFEKMREERAEEVTQIATISNEIRRSISTLC